MKKISFVVTSLKRSGAERVVSLLADNALKHGYDVEIVYILFHGVEYKLDPKIKTIDLAGFTDSRIKRIFYWLKNLKKYFKNRRPDVTISFIGRVNIFTLLTARKYTKKLIVSERNDPRYDGRTWITNLFIKWLYPKADKVVFQTQEAMGMFSKRIQNKATVIPNPITISEFVKLDEYDSNLVLYAGRYSHQKDVMTIIKAAEIVKEKIPQIRFELYGSGELKNQFIEYVNSHDLKENVFINENVPNIIEKMRNSFLFVMSSLYEGMSNSLMEASYSGVPCLTTPTLGTSMIVDGVNGRFFNFKDYQSLARIIVDLYNDKNAYMSLRKNALEIAQKADHKKVYDMWNELIEEKSIN